MAIPRQDGLRHGSVASPERWGHGKLLPILWLDPDDR